MLVSEDTVFAGLLTDAAGKVTTWNEGCEQLFGIPADAALDRPLTDLVDGAATDVLLKHWSGHNAHCDAL